MSAHSNIYIYMEVTKDELQQPLAVEMSIKALARRCGVSENAVASIVC